MTIGGAFPSRRRGGAQQVPRPSDWRPGEPASWPEPASAVAVAPVAPRLAAGPLVAPAHPDDFSHPLRPDGSRASAVLAVLVDGPAGAEVLLTRRSAHLSHHGGEMSFPGGRVDPGEGYAEAALREAHEEVGLPPSAVSVLGALEPINTWVSRSWIVPIVARADGQAADWASLAPATTEVDRVLWVPLVELTRPGTFREERWRTDRGELAISFFELDDETVWGATARILRAVLGAVHGGTPR
ncbi:MAG: NUDIX hydrolase [Ilumatobacteraceae bacterium]